MEPYEKSFRSWNRKGERRCVIQQATLGKTAVRVIGRFNGVIIAVRVACTLRASRISTRIIVATERSSQFISGLSRGLPVARHREFEYKDAGLRFR